MDSPSRLLPSTTCTRPLAEGVPSRGGDAAQAIITLADFLSFNVQNQLWVLRSTLTLKTTDTTLLSVDGDNGRGTRMLLYTCHMPVPKR